MRQTEEFGGRNERDISGKSRKDNRNKDKIHLRNPRPDLKQDNELLYLFKGGK